mmetsp:Transcript_68559/g.212016  ORF Transcript_68559/g.212016 Transcript_68559/m.212016 type:complete len:129 (+) Transcript_68559:682-1068(+)
MPINHILGYGFNFEHRSTRPTDERYDKHHVVNRVQLGELLIAVRADVDAVNDAGEEVELKTMNAKYRGANKEQWTHAAVQMRLGRCKELVVGWQQEGTVEDIEMVNFEELVNDRATGYDGLFGVLEGS